MKWIVSPPFYKTVLQFSIGGKRPLNLDEPQPPKIIPKCPKHLDENARKEWRRISLELHRLNPLTIVDRAALAAYCQAWGRWVEAEDNIQRFGAVIKTPKGSRLVNPYLRIAERAIHQMRKFLVEFGMTPSSRSRIKGSDPEGGPSPLQKILRAREQRRQALGLSRRERFCAAWRGTLVR